jgi:aminoglycoside phosphotransferase (APT) family kinase protein
MDLQRLRIYLDAEGLLPGELTASVVSGGKSNLTYLLHGLSDRLVLRRPPLGHVLPTAHDMGREYTVIAALHPTGFPVPAPFHLCRDESVIGAPFYLMSYVDGVVLRGSTAESLDPVTAARTGESLVDTLAALHAIDPISVGLGEFGRPSGYLERQVRRWYQQWQASKTQDLSTLDALAMALGESIPPEQPAGIVHGDYRLDNCVYTHDLARILAVLDWEMATLGDPLADLGLLVAYTDLAAVGLSPTPGRLDPGSGFLTGRELVARYAGTSGRSVDRIGWYEALAYYKLAIISEGIHARFLAGQTVGEGFAGIGGRVPELVDRARTALST